MIGIQGQEDCTGAIRHGIVIERQPEHVFSCLDDLARNVEWQTEIVSARVVTDGPTRVGTRCEDIPRAGGREQKMTYEITEHSPRANSQVGPAGICSVRSPGPAGVTAKSVALREPRATRSHTQTSRARTRRPPMGPLAPRVVAMTAFSERPTIFLHPDFHSRIVADGSYDDIGILAER
jgi:hypothetical protein